MKKVIDYDPFTQITSVFEQEESTGVVHISQSADVQGALDHCKELANDEEYTKQGIKGEMWHYAHVPAIVLEQLYKKGINPYEKGNTKEIIKIINEEYPYLKTTHKRHAYKA